MSNPGIPSRFELERTPPEELSRRIRAAVAATSASRTSLRLRVAVAVPLVALLSATALLVASQLVFDRPALRSDLVPLATSELWVEIVGVVALTLVATIVALGRGENGLGPSVTWLLLVALLDAPVYAVLTVTGALQTSAAGAASLGSAGALPTIARPTGSSLLFSRCCRPAGAAQRLGRNGPGPAA